MINQLSLFFKDEDIMRQLILGPAFVLLTFTTLRAQTKPQSADIIMKEACQSAAKENKNIIVIFHASWCGWCHKMDSSLEDPSCKNFFDNNYVIRHLVVDESQDKKNLENPGAVEFRKKLGGDDQGLPFWAVMNKDEKVLFDSRLVASNAGTAVAGTGQNIGCPANEIEVAYFIDILKNTSKLNTQQLELIRQRFRKNQQ